MMEDWTDIIGEELENIEEPLPADDWSVLQQKFAASRRRKRTTFFTWAGGITSAAAVALVLLLVRPTEVPSGNELVADELPPAEEVIPTDTVSTETPSDTSDVVVPKKRHVPAAINVIKPSDDVVIAQDKTEVQAPDGNLLAYAGDNNDEKVVPNEEDKVYPGFEDLLEEEPKRRRRKVSLGVSGSASASPIIRMFDINPDLAGPKDTSEVDNPEPVRSMMHDRSSYTERYRHEIPKSFGVSARFHLTERLTINTGLNYTMYASDRTRTFADRSYQNDRQYVHYLGIPVRLDWLIVNRKHFSFYLGAGMQADKCIYATAGDERLHEKQVLFGLNGALGLQVNIVPAAGLYFEPDISYSLNEGSLKTYRSREPFVVTLRGGLRFTF